MFINIYDAKTKQINKVNITYIKLLEFTKTSIKITFKDSRTPGLTLKASQITFDD